MNRNPDRSAEARQKPRARGVVKRVLLLLACTQFLVGAVTAEHTLMMPEGFEDVQLGVAQSALRELRPGAEAFEIFGEPEETSSNVEIWVEILTDHPRFDSVDYTFVKDRLCAIKWQSVPASDFSTLRAAALREAVRRWGDTYSRLVFEVAPDIVLPALRWSEGPVAVILTYTPSENGQTRQDERTLPELLQVMIFTDSCLPPEAEELLNKLKEGSEEVSAHLFVDLSVKSTGPHFE